MSIIRTIAEWYDDQPIFDRRAIPAYAAFNRLNARLFLEMTANKTTPKIALVNPYRRSVELFDAILSGTWYCYARGNRHPWLTMRENWVFRAVHDYYGHFMNRATFSLEGELRAARAHLNTAERLAKLNGDYDGAGPAIAMETIGQICYYYTHREYAPQKLGLMPMELLTEVLS